MYECTICKIDPTSHSFKHVGVFNNVNYFYTCPAKSTKYYDCEGIIKHYKGTLDDYPEQQWTWIFDCAGFETKHALEVKVAIKLAKLISKHYSNTLQKIEIVNPSTHIKNLLAIVTPFLNEKTKKVIVIK